MCAYATLTGMATREQLWREPRTRALFCPECGQGLRDEGWTPAGEDGYTTWASCAEHGRFLCKLRLKNLKRSKWTAALSVYTQEEAEKPGAASAAQRRRSGWQEGERERPGAAPSRNSREAKTETINVEASKEENGDGLLQGEEPSSFFMVRCKGRRGGFGKG